MSDCVTSLAAFPLGLHPPPGGGFLHPCWCSRYERKLLLFPWWVGQHFISRPVAHNRPPAVCGIKRLAINETPLIGSSCESGCLQRGRSPTVQRVHGAQFSGHVCISLFLFPLTKVTYNSSSNKTPTQLFNTAVDI